MCRYASHLGHYRPTVAVSFPQGESLSVNGNSDSTAFKSMLCKTHSAQGINCRPETSSIPRITARQTTFFSDSNHGHESLSSQHKRFVSLVLYSLIKAILGAAGGDQTDGRPVTCPTPSVDQSRCFVIIDKQSALFGSRPRAPAAGDDKSDLAADGWWHRGPP